MTRTVADVMTTHVVTVPTTARIRDAAEAMKRHDIGDVVLVADGVVRGILTDRDIVIRAVASDMNPRNAPIATVLSPDVVTVRPDTSLEDAATTMRERAIRRLPVVDADGHPVGIVTIGDLAATEDPDSALSDISMAPPNK